MVRSVITEKREGYFGEYGGRFVPPALEGPLDDLARGFAAAVADEEFQREYVRLLHEFVGRPSALSECLNLSEKLGGGRLFLKREDLNHTGAHKINNALGQALLAKQMGRTRLIAETGAGMHGVAVATVAALMGMDCVVYMGALDVKRQAPNVSRMKLLGTSVVSVTRGQGTLKEAVDAAWEACVADPRTFYILGSAVGPHPYPSMVRHFQEVIGTEARDQMLRRKGRLPDEIVACVGGGSNAIGLFSAFLKDTSVSITGVEPAGKGLNSGEHAATLAMGTPGILHGFRSYVLRDSEGQPAPVYSISAGLDYPGVGPEHAYLKDSGRVSYVSVTDQEALDAFHLLCRTEGIIPALESAHALAYAVKRLSEMKRDEILLVNLSGRGDKDMDQIMSLESGDIVS